MQNQPCRRRRAEQSAELAQVSKAQMSTTRTTTTTTHLPPSRDKRLVSAGIPYDPSHRSRTRHSAIIPKTKAAQAHYNTTSAKRTRLAQNNPLLCNSALHSGFLHNRVSFTGRRHLFPSFARHGKALIRGRVRATITCTCYYGYSGERIADCASRARARLEVRDICILGVNVSASRWKF